MKPFLQAARRQAEHGLRDRRRDAHCLLGSHQCQLVGVLIHVAIDLCFHQDPGSCNQSRRIDGWTEGQTDEWMDRQANMQNVKEA